MRRLRELDDLKLLLMMIKERQRERNNYWRMRSPFL